MVAAQEVSSHNAKVSIICWADVILARLGEAIQAIIEGLHPPLNPQTLGSGTLLRHRDEISLHAALQLPHNWDDTVSVISSEYASPATIRLVVRLVFAAYILSPKLAAQDEAYRHWPACGAGTLKNTPLIQVTPNLDVAQSIVYKWGVTVPWMWLMWQDERILDYVVVEHASIIESLAELLVHLLHDTRATDVKDIIIVGLACVEAKDLWSALTVCTAKNVFKMKLEDKWYAGVEEHIPEESSLSFMKAALNLVSSRAQHDHAASRLVGPLIIAQTFFEVSGRLGKGDGTTTKQRRETIWNLALAEDVTNISVTSAFAAYISVTVRSMEDLHIVEAWNQMRDFVFLVYRRDFHGTDDPLALLVCPTVCIAMQDLRLPSNIALD
ncbi:hypothetical protein EIP86_002987 [Pleurotus ostreatoroseus]|nr:hypothetical protein EIP86_002987 [Pleurotus ostreatoroseus]